MRGRFHNLRRNDPWRGPLTPTFVPTLPPSGFARVARALRRSVWDNVTSPLTASPWRNRQW
jgi:hypothetical protein